MESEHLDVFLGVNVWVAVVNVWCLLGVAEVNVWVAVEHGIAHKREKC